jgi:ADP-ribosylglycohydrolase
MSQSLTSSLTSIHGAILGTVIGDAIGLPYEALSRRRGQRLLGPPNRHRFLLGRGMMSDDGEHTCMIAQALCVAGGDVERFRRAFAQRLRWWLLGIPAGTGSATLRATLKLWMGISPARSGVFSAGNGPAMRSAVLGAAIDDAEQLARFVAASTLVTHTDPKALYGAMAVAVAASCARSHDFQGQHYLSKLSAALANSSASECLDLIARVVESVDQGQTTITFAESLGARRGVSGYVYQSVPVAIHAWLRSPTDYRQAIQTAVECGGDTDTVAAITGGIVGAAVGPAGIPADWQRGLWEWPRSLAWLERLAQCVTENMATDAAIAPPRVGPTVLARNALFLAAVFGHLFRRALPPY